MRSGRWAVWGSRRAAAEGRTGGREDGFERSGQFVVLERKGDAGNPAEQFHEVVEAQLWGPRGEHGLVVGLVPLNPAQGLLDGEVQAGVELRGEEGAADPAVALVQGVEVFKTKVEEGRRLKDRLGIGGGANLPCRVGERAQVLRESGRKGAELNLGDDDKVRAPAHPPTGARFQQPDGQPLEVGGTWRPPVGGAVGVEQFGVRKEGVHSCEDSIALGSASHGQKSRDTAWTCILTTLLKLVFFINFCYDIAIVI